jgi:hypothetical protein
MPAMTSSWERTCSASGDSSDRGGDHLGVSLGDLREHVAQEVHPASLPGSAEQHRLDRGLEPGMRVRDDQLHTVQATGLERA